MLTPTGVTAAQYNAAVKNNAQSHIRLTFADQNVVFNDEDIESNGIDISTLLNGDSDLVFGRAVMSEFNITLFVSEKTERLLWDKECLLEIGLEVNGSTVWTTIGYYTGKRPDKMNESRTIVFTATDRMQKFDVLADDWLSSLTYPKTLKQMYDSLCTFVGLENVTGDELSNIMSRSFTAAPIAENGLMCRDILALIAEAAGCYAKITNAGKVKLIWYSDHTDYEITGDEEFSTSSLDINFGDDSKTWQDLEQYTWEDLEQYRWDEIEYYRQQLHIKVLNVKQTEDDIGVAYPSGTTGLTYLIVDNPFLFTETDQDITDYIKPIFDRLDDFGGYVPMDIECLGNPLVEAGDIISVEILGEMIELPIFVKNMHVSASCTDRYEATGNVTRQTVSRQNKQKLSQGGRYHIFRNDLKELYSELYDPTTGDISIIQQLASELGLSASGIHIVGGKYVKIESGGVFDVDSTNFKLSSEDREMIVGDIHYTESGISRGFEDTQAHYNVFYTLSGEIDLDDASPDSNAVASGINVLYQNNRPMPGIALYLHKKTSSTYDRRYLVFMQIISASSPTDDGFDVSFQGDGKCNLGSLKPYDYIYTNHNVVVSSRKQKHNIKDIPSVGDELDKLCPVSFAYNNDKEEKKQYGLIYEDVIKVIPEICVGDPDNENEVKGINYSALVPLLLKEIQDLRKRVDHLEKKVEKLERK